MKKKSIVSRKIIAIFASLLLLLNIIVPTGLVKASSTDAEMNDQIEKNLDVDPITVNDEQELPEEQVTEQPPIGDDVSVKSSSKTVKQERGPPKKVTVRVETHEKTIVEPTEVEVSVFDLEEYINRNNNGNSAITETPRAIHAIIQALEEKTNLDLKDDSVFGLGFGGNYIQKIDGDAEFTGGLMSGWKYYIDNAYVDRGVLDRELEDGESIVLYYTINFTDSTYSWFEEEAYATETGENLELKLNSDGSNPIANATLLIDNVAQEDLVTDGNGLVTVNFDEPGTYHLSANRLNKSGERNIVRPYAKVEVKPKEIPKIDKKALESIIKEAESLKREDKTDESIDALDKAMSDAEAVLADKSATQKDVDESVKVLNEAIDGLIDIPTADFSKLEAAIETGNKADKKNKTDESIVVLEQVIVDAEVVLADKSVTQKDVDAAVKVLNEAIKGLTEITEEKPDSQAEEELQETLNKSVESAIGYAENHFPDYTDNKSGSHSDYWAFSALWGAGIKDIENDFAWKGGIKPSASHTFWEQKLSKKNKTSNEDAGTIIGAVILGQSPYDFGTQNVVADLEAKQKENGSFFHIWGESWAMIALELVDSKVYEKDKHIDYILGLQDKEGLFGDADSTGWMLTALAPYTETHPAVKQAMDKSIKHIHSTYKDTGTLPGMKHGENSNAITSMHMGLAANGENLLSDKWTNDKNIIEEFIEEYQFEDGSFAWNAGSTAGALNMSTEQVILSFATIKEQESIFTQLKEEKNRINKEVLEDLVKEAKGIDTTDKTEKSIKALEEVITDSEDILEDESATQKSIDKAVKALNKVIKGLIEIKPEETITIQSITDIKPIDVPFGTIEDEIEFPKEIELNLDNETSVKTSVEWNLKERSGFDGTKPGAYTFIGQYELPENVSGDKAEVSMTVTVLEDVINKSELEDLIVSANKINTIGKTEKSIQKLLNSIKQAEKTVSNSDATQKEVDKAVESLEQTISKLVEAEKEMEEIPEEDSKEQIVSKDSGETDDLEKDKQKVESDSNQVNKDKQLPSTATNIFNLLALGFVLIILGLLFVRKRKVN